MIVRLFTPLLFAICIISFSPGALAQDWKKDLSEITGGINWMTQANDGTIVVGGPQAMAGFDPETGAERWKHPRLSKQNLGTVQMLEEMPLMLVKGSSSKRSEDFGALAVVNTIDGQLVFSSRDAGVEVLQHTLLPETRGMLLQINKEDQLELAYYDLVEGKARWSVPLRVAGTSGRGVTTALKLSPILSSDGALLLALDKTVRAVELNTGATRWEKTYDDEADMITLSDDESMTFIGIDRAVDVLKTSDGTPVGASPYDMRAKLLGVETTPEHYLIRSTRGLHLFDPKQERMVWDKIDLIGNTITSFVVPGGYLLRSSEEDPIGFIKVDADGKKQWSERVSGTYVFHRLTDEGLLYVTNSSANVLRFDDGKNVMKKSVKIKGTPAVAIDKDADEIVFFSDKTLTRLNLKTLEASELNDEIKLSKFDDAEMLAQIELIPGGYFISSSQHAVMIDREGKELFNYYFAPVRQGAGMSMAMAGGSLAGVDVSGTMRTAKMFQGLSGNATTTSAQRREKIAVGAYVGNSPAFEITSARYYATQATQDKMYIFGEGEQGPTLHKIDKASGNTDKTFVLGVKEPTYLVDEYGKKLYYKEGTQIVGTAL